MKTINEDTGEVLERDPVAETKLELDTIVPKAFPAPPLPSDTELASLINLINGVAASLDAALWGYEQELKARMVGRAATALIHEALDVKLSPPTARYDDIKADQLLKDWEAGKIELPTAARSLIYTTKPAEPRQRVDGRIAKEIEKFGGAAAERIQKMRAIPSSSEYKLKI